MSGLSAFLKQNAILAENIKFPASKRFVEDGNPVEWEIKAIAYDEAEAIKKTCTKRVPVQGQKGVMIPETDLNKYLGALAVACVVFPNLNDAELQNSYGVLGAENLLKKMLLPGEYGELMDKIQEVCGFDQSTDELVDDAKN